MRAALLCLAVGSLAVTCDAQTRPQPPVQRNSLRPSSSSQLEEEDPDLRMAPTSNTTNSNCPQSLVDTNPPPSQHYIYPASPITPFYQWAANNGYCGEVFVVQAGMAHGQWLSQFWVRRVCGASLASNPPGKAITDILPKEPARGFPRAWQPGTPLSQSGPDGWCAMFNETPSYNAQLLIEGPDGAGLADYAQAARCLANAQLQAIPFDSVSQAPGHLGYMQYMSWIKNQTLQGNYINMGVLMNGFFDVQYDHEVTVLKIGTNHNPKDPSYFPDDVLYFDDHGLVTVLKNDKGGFEKFNKNTAIPPGAGDPKSRGCVTYSYGYNFSEMAKTREAANAFRLTKAGATKTAEDLYSIVLPGPVAKTYTGGDGLTPGPAIAVKNRAIAVSGIVGLCAAARPVQLSIVSTTTNGVANPLDPLAGANYENPYIGETDTGNDCSNTQPDPMAITFKVTVSNLTPGKKYVLYEYQQTTVTGVGAESALRFPVCDFATATPAATNTAPFTANATTFSTQVVRPSNVILAFRAAPA